MRLLITNDDGIYSPGIAALALAAQDFGEVRIVAPDGRLSEPLADVPKVLDRGQGGLLDVALDPAFATNGTIYLSYSEPGSDGAGTAVARALFAQKNL